MKILSFLSISVLALCSSLHIHVDGDIDDNDNLDEDNFETQFGLKKVHYPVEKAKRREALQTNELIVKEENKDFINGNKTWFAKIYEFADLSEAEFKKEKTGGKMPRFARGGLLPPVSERMSEESERYFDKFRQNRANVPSSYSSVERGLVSPVRNQKQCGSCVAFATVATIETCFKKLTGVFGDYSEQELVDCAYGQHGAEGCDGASYHAYAKWIAINKKKLAHESLYPYLSKYSYSCPRSLEPYNQGAKVTDFKYTYSGNEGMHKELVYEHGAVLIGINTDDGFEDYEGGIFDSCRSSEPLGHAVTVVGYDTEDGVDYWLIKNSWGRDWGEQGYMKLKRGVGMCGIGRYLVTVSCGSSHGPTDAPLTTAKPCFDKYTNCAELARDNCYSNGEECPKSCGLCKGMTPHKSNTCYNLWSNCNELTGNCDQARVKKHCKKSCQACDGDNNEPAPPSCSDYWNNCRDNAAYYCPRWPESCNKTCGKC